MEQQILVFRVVDNKEGSRAIMVLRESDGGRVLRQVDVYNNPTHLQKETRSVCILEYSFWVS